MNKKISVFLIGFLFLLCIESKACAENVQTITLAEFGRISIPAGTEASEIMINGQRAISFLANDNNTIRTTITYAVPLSSVSLDNLTKSPALTQSFIDLITRVPGSRVLQSDGFTELTLGSKNIVTTNIIVLMNGLTYNLKTYIFENTIGSTAIVFLSSNADNEYWEALRTNILMDANVCFNLKNNAKLATLSKTTVNWSSGFRQDNLSWNTAGHLNGINPNVLSELTWKNLNIYQIKANIQRDLKDNLLVDGSLSYGWIYSGSTQDSDYRNDNRTNEYSRAYCNATGNVVDASLGIGYYTYSTPVMKNAVLLGYSINEQNFTLTNGVKVIGSYHGAFPGLHSTYNSRWTGPWVGYISTKKLNDKLKLYTRLEYHWTKLYGVGNWNLRTDLAHPRSFENIGSGNGITLSLGTDYKINQSWNLNCELNYANFWMNSGVNSAYHSNGIVSATLLNEQNWNSFAAMIRATRKY